MKNITALFLLLFQSLFALAQHNKSNRSTLNIHLSDGAPLIVTINDRSFKKVNTLITIADLPRKRHNIQVYKFRAYADGQGGKAELMYSGNFKIEPGYTYDCIVDVNTRKLYIKKVTPGMETYTPPPAAPAPDFRKDVPLGASGGKQLAPGLFELNKKMEAVKEDTKKLQLAQDYIGMHMINTSDLRQIVSWIMFDDNKMKLLKTAYPSVQDKELYAGLKDIFTMPATQKEFEDYARSLK
ncbi:hypothetical protein D3C72_506940 [compost metagenome]